MLSPVRKMGLDIGFFTDSYFPEVDGVTYTLETWKERLEERGHEVHVVFPESPDYSPGDDEKAVRSFPNPFYEGYRIPKPVLPGIDLDIVHCHSPGPIGISGLVHSKRKDISSVYTHHTPIEEYFEQSIRLKSVAALTKKLYVPLENLFISRFDARTASTEPHRREGCFRKVPVGVDTDFFRPQSVELSDLFGREFERPGAGYSGRLSMEKNPEVLIRFAQKFEGTLVMVGEGPMREDLESDAPENVFFSDFLDREDLPAFYSALDLFVTASTGDTLGLSTLEAKACKTPVVAPDVNPFHRTLKPGSVLFRKGSPESTLEAVNQTLKREASDPRDEVLEYSVEKSVDSLERIYREVFEAD